MIRPLYIFFPRLARALWRAGRSLDPKTTPNPYPTHMSRITTDQAAEIITSLVGALETTRSALRATQAQLAPAQAELAAADAADAAVDAALLAAKAKLDAWHAEEMFVEAVQALPETDYEMDSQAADQSAEVTTQEPEVTGQDAEVTRQEPEVTGQDAEVARQEPTEETPGA